MLITIANLFSTDEAAHIREQLIAGEWQDGSNTAGSQAKAVKSNRQLNDNSQLAKHLQRLILTRLNQSPQFISAALPAKIFPAKFNCYGNKGCYGPHVDAAIMTLPGHRQMRTDIACTLFLTPPTEYEGGELCIEDRYGQQAIKLNAGDMVVYPATSWHEVKPVTNGKRVCAFFWLQSLVRNAEQRSYLYDLDTSIQNLSQRLGNQDPEVQCLTGLYHNLVRAWSNT